MKERDDAAKACFAALDKWTARIAKDWKKPCDPKLAAQNKMLAELDAAFGPRAAEFGEFELCVFEWESGLG